MSPAPITAPVMSRTSEPQGILSSQPPVPGVGHAPPGAPGELGPQVTMCSLPLGNLPALLGYRRAGGLVDGPHP